jgi:hypothetical protein
MIPLCFCFVVFVPHPHAKLLLAFYLNGQSTIGTCTGKGILEKIFEKHVLVCYPHGTSLQNYHYCYAEAHNCTAPQPSTMGPSFIRSQGNGQHQECHNETDGQEGLPVGHRHFRLLAHIQKTRHQARCNQNYCNKQPSCRNVPVDLREHLHTSHFCLLNHLYSITMMGLQSAHTHTQPCRQPPRY